MIDIKILRHTHTRIIHHYNTYILLSFHQEFKVFKTKNEKKYFNLAIINNSYLLKKYIVVIY